ncbi:MAG: hypothetical protein FWG34_13525 [Oscillospiraceae bacterium]|nr:hypothetical protein [Oscillospiraceae bacterium]
MSNLLGIVVAVSVVLIVLIIIIAIISKILKMILELCKMVMILLGVTAGIILCAYIAIGYLPTVIK